MRASQRWLARTGLAAVIAVGGVLGAASPAFATDCAGLQAALDAASPGDVVTLDEGSICGGAYTLPSRTVTLEGAGSGAAFDGGGTMRSLTGTDVGDTTIRNLTFHDGYSPTSGGAISITGDSAPTLDGLSFTHNRSDQSGGAVYIASLSASGTVRISGSSFGDGTDPGANDAGGSGGAAYVFSGGAAVSIEHSDFVHNTADTVGGGMVIYGSGAGAAVSISDSSFSGNTLAKEHSGEGAGAYVIVAGTCCPVTLERSAFTGNVIQPGAGFLSAIGAGLSITTTGAGSIAVDSTDNSYSSNSIEDGSNDDGAHGAGLSVFGGSLTSLRDRFVSNTLSRTDTSAAGAGLSFSGCSAAGDSATLTDAALAGNRIVGGGLGGAAVIGCPSGKARVDLRSVTLSGNQVDSGTAGIAGGDEDTLTGGNTILTGNAGGADISGFETQTFNYSDVCSGGKVYAGFGNICAPPQLVGASTGDIHESPTSTTLDAGSNALVAGIDTDFEGDARIRDGGTGQGFRTDIGADEAGAIYQPPPSGGGFVLPPEPEDEAPATVFPGKPLPQTPGQEVEAQRAAAKKVFIKIISIGRRGRKGTFAVRFRSSGGAIELLATYPKGKKTKNGRSAALRPGKGQVLLGRARGKVKAGRAALRLRPTKAARRYFVPKRRITVRVVVRLKPPAAKARLFRQKVRVRIPARRPG